MEANGYRATLAGVLESSGGRHLLTKADVLRYTGLTDYRTLDHMGYPFVNKRISAESLAQAICGGKR